MLFSRSVALISGWDLDVESGGVWKISVGNMRKEGDMSRAGYRMKGGAHPRHGIMKCCN